MENKRLIITIFIVVVLVSVLFISNTYSVFTSENADPNTNVYTTGNLDITYEIENNDVKFTDSKPISDKDVGSIKPYRIKVTNSGNVDYKFNIILEDTTATEVINYKYIMVKVGKYDAVSLNTTSNNVVREGVVVKANSSVLVDVKVYISDKISNSEVGKNFSAKLSINGIAIASSDEVVDNSKLVSDYQLLSSASSGSFVVFDNDISFDNANYVNDDDMGYCFNISNKYRFNGYRLLYVKDEVPYVISGGANYCYDNVDNDNVSGIVNDINDKINDYCDSKYIFDGKCTVDNVHIFNVDDYKAIINKEIDECDKSNDLYCGYNNEIINNGGYYYIGSSDNMKMYYWDPVNGFVDSTSRFNIGYGIRVVLKLDSKLYIEKGTGTFDNPYVVKNKIN
ncbi:MAG: hypothetical protein IJI43_00070 [Bacilli bacterium]|nr:hypothetical protein [Bacilli bacterium]